MVLFDLEAHMVPRWLPADYDMIFYMVCLALESGVRVLYNVLHFFFRKRTCIGYMVSSTSGLGQASLSKSKVPVGGRALQNEGKPLPTRQ